MFCCHKEIKRQLLNADFTEVSPVQMFSRMFRLVLCNHMPKSVSAMISGLNPKSMLFLQN